MPFFDLDIDLPIFEATVIDAPDFGEADPADALAKRGQDVAGPVAAVQDRLQLGGLAEFGNIAAGDQIKSVLCPFFF